GNLEVNSNAKALTGTFARADNKTFERHLRALDESVSSDVRRIYLSLADRSLDLAEGAGQNAEDVRMIRDGIVLAQQRSK
ncbi:MAG: DUF2520 domain-containing protein, partial [Pyrinomonadaceae bacterium]